LHPHDRRRYLQRVAQLLRGQEVGDGSLHRACERAQLELRQPSAAAAIDGRRPPQEERGRRPHSGKYA
jgi:hypothetical protein